MNTRFDHLAFGANTLEVGLDYLQDLLGVTIPFGGKHIKMGTHNAVMKLGENCYFELITIDHDAPPPARPRWFAMDHAVHRLAVERKPRLLTWVVNTDDLDQCRTISSYPYPEGLNMTRKTDSGTLSWSITVPEDGNLPADGLLPSLIQWHHGGTHPARGMPDLGCRLQSIRLHHPYPSWLEDHLKTIDCHQMVDIVPLSGNESAYMTATLETPNGVVTLSGGL